MTRSVAADQPEVRPDLPANDRLRDRMHWRCRRGMLELDLVLNAFLERHLARLDPARLAAFNTLLARTDPELLELVMGREEGRDDLERELLTLMRNEPCNESSIQPLQ